MQVVEFNYKLLNQIGSVIIPKFCSKCGAKIDDDSDFCTKCGNELNNNKSSNHFSVNKKLVYTIVVIVVIAIIGIFAYNHISHTNALSEIIDSANIDKVWVSDWNNRYWNEDKILYVTFTPTKDINNSDGGEISFDELIVTYNDGSSEKIFSMVGEWCRDKVLRSGESYTTGIGFESNGKEPTHVSGKLIVYHKGENITDMEKEVIAHFDADV